MDTTTDKTREIRLRRAAQRQGFTLHKSRTRDPLAIGYGLFHVADIDNRIVTEGGLRGYEMSLDDVEVYLADAQDFDVYFLNPHGDYSPGDRPILEWIPSYRGLSVWLLTERSDTPREHFFGAGRNDLAVVALVARAKVAAWTQQPMKISKAEARRVYHALCARTGHLTGDQMELLRQVERVAWNRDTD
jgi:hypothetical protein